VTSARNRHMLPHSRPADLGIVEQGRHAWHGRSPHLDHLITGVSLYAPFQCWFPGFRRSTATRAMRHVHDGTKTIASIPGACVPVAHSPEHPLPLAKSNFFFWCPNRIWRDLRSGLCG